VRVFRARLNYARRVDSSKDMSAHLGAHHDAALRQVAAAMRASPANAAFRQMRDAAAHSVPAMS